MEFGEKQRNSVDIPSKRPVLKIFDPNLEIELHTDESSAAIAILYQVHPDGKHPVAYLSKHCTFKQSRHRSFELETVAVVFALKHFRTYLFGLHFKVFTYCTAIKKQSEAGYALR